MNKVHTHNANEFAVLMIQCQLDEKPAAVFDSNGNIVAANELFESMMIIEEYGEKNIFSHFPILESIVSMADEELRFYSLPPSTRLTVKSLFTSSKHLFLAVMDFPEASSHQDSFNTEKSVNTKESELMQLGALADRTAHDLNNLLTALFGNVAQLKKIVTDVSASEVISIIEQALSRATKINSQLLRSKKNETSNEFIDVTELSREISSVMEVKSNGKLEFEISISPDLVMWKANATKVYQLLQNLCINAYESSESLDRIPRIALSFSNLEVSQENRESFPELSMGSYVFIEVSDNGCGISEENISHIFEKHFSTKERELDSGIGLFASLQIVKEFDGAIKVRSKLGEGTTFSVCFPAHEYHLLNKDASKTVVIVDDEKMILDLFAEMLEELGYVSRIYSDPLDFLKDVQNELSFGLAIIDYTMPNQNGLECIAQLREKHPSVPVILSSGTNEYEEHLSPRSLNVTEIISKPYNFEILQQVIKKLLSN
mgnify:CR=1 FL=1